MRVTIYNTEITDDKRTILVKESSKNCPEIDKIDMPKKAVQLLNKVFKANKLAEEYVWLLALDCHKSLIGVFEISHGVVWRSLVGAREIFIRLCLCGATNFIIAHNHPGATEMKHSIHDTAVTSRLIKAGELMDISFNDHIIIGCDENYFSFKECDYFDEKSVKEDPDVLLEEDFCAWFHYDATSITSTEHKIIWQEPENFAHLKFCPICGKKVFMY